jgi:hypothetical protein
MSRGHATAVLACRGCGAPPTRRGDQVSDAACAYLCSRCFTGAAPAPTIAPDGRGGVTQGGGSGTASEASSGPGDSDTCNTIKRYRAIRAGRAHTPGRPKVSAARKRQVTRARVRAWRAGATRRVLGPGTPTAGAL